MSEPCAIWQTKAVLSSGRYTGRETFNSPRAGGAYEITGTAKVTVQELTAEQKAELTSWLVDQRFSGNECPLVTDSEVERAKIVTPKGIKERRNRLLRIVEQQTPKLGDTLKYSMGPVAWMSGMPYPENPNWGGEETLMAATGSVNWGEVETLIGFATSQRLLKDDDGLSLTYEGLTLLDEISVTGQDSIQAFVAMWFSSEMTQVYDIGIEPAIRDAGYRPMRIDRKEHNNKIDDEIIAEIRRSRFVIADFTCGMANHSGGVTAIPRGGVYYEAGFAQGLGIPVIWMCREDQIGMVHFDTRQFNHITWKGPEELREKLRNRIGAVLGDGPMIDSK